MQFKTIAAILLAITATGALAGPVAQVRLPNVFVEYYQQDTDLSLA